MSENKKDKTLNVRLSASEKESIEKDAKDAGLSTSDYVRIMALSKEKVIVLASGQEIAKHLIKVYILFQEALEKDQLSCIAANALQEKMDALLEQFTLLMKQLPSIQGVTKIGWRAFAYCSSLISIIIPESVTEIGEWAFGRCSSLTSITIPSSVKKIGRLAFCECKSLISITIPGSVTEIEEVAFHSCSSLISVTIEDGVKKIGEYSFYKCESLKSITIPDSVTEIGVGAFDETSAFIEASDTILKRLKQQKEKEEEELRQLMEQKNDIIYAYYKEKKKTLFPH